MSGYKECISMLTIVSMSMNFLSTSAYYGAVNNLFEGNPCPMEDGSTGECLRIFDCPMRIKQIREGKYNFRTGRCSFDDNIEIVCCPQSSIFEPGYDGTDVGSPCKMEDGSEGDCTALPKCPSRVKEVLEGNRFPTSAGRCSFDGNTEIVCCPRDNQPTNEDVPNGVHVRSSDKACDMYMNQITGQDGETINSNIINGESVDLGEFPYMAALGYLMDPFSPQLNYSCGGTLISDKHILTAAHCLSNINEWVPVVARLGTVNLLNPSDSVQDIPVARNIPHPNYRRSLNYYDIGIVVLQRSVMFSQYVIPICLQTIPLNLEQLLSVSLVVTGWGATSLTNEGVPDLQKTPSLKLVGTEDCKKDYKDFSKVPGGLDNSFICLIDEDVARSSDACQGDSGGPLLLLSLYSSTVIGIVSFGQSCGSRIPSVYTSVYYYLDWIEQNVWP